MMWFIVVVMILGFNGNCGKVVSVCFKFFLKFDGLKLFVFIRVVVCVFVWVVVIVVICFFILV